MIIIITTYFSRKLSSASWMKLSVDKSYANFRRKLSMLVLNGHNVGSIWQFVCCPISGLVDKKKQFLDIFVSYISITDVINYYYFFSYVIHFFIVINIKLIIQYSHF